MWVGPGKGRPHQQTKGIQTMLVLLVGGALASVVRTLDPLTLLQDKASQKTALVPLEPALPHLEVATLALG